MREIRKRNADNKIPRWPCEDQTAVWFADIIRLTGHRALLLYYGMKNMWATRLTVLD